MVYVFNVYMYFCIINFFLLFSTYFQALTRAAYNSLGLQTYFTAGPTETRAWTINKGMTAPQVIYTLFFIYYFLFCDLCFVFMIEDGVVIEEGELSGKELEYKRRQLSFISIYFVLVHCFYLCLINFIYLFFLILIFYYIGCWSYTYRL